MAQNEFTDFEIEMDLEQVDAWGGEQRPLCPPGDYILEVKHVEQKNSKNQQPMIAVTYEVAEGELLGTRVYNNYSLQPQSRGRVKQFMIACGMNLAKFVAGEALGAKIRGTVVHVDGQPSTDAQGNVRPAGVFANVVNEQPLETQAAPQTKAAPPPVLNKGQANAKPTNAQPRRT